MKAGQPEVVSAHRGEGALAALATRGLVALSALLLTACTTDFGPHDDGPRCGDGVAEAPEACDGSDLAGASCADFGEVGSLGCRADCTLDRGGCLSLCGNGTRDASEACDGTDLGDATCQDAGFHEGVLACGPGCTFDTAGCLGRCGDRMISGPEACDGTALAGSTCATLGFYAGELTCDGDCTFDTASCLGHCGDDLINGPEACDGIALGGHLCSDFGYAGGTLACQADCLAFDYAGCWTEPRVVVNEIFAGIPDWLELRNVSEVSVALEGWTVGWWAVQDNGSSQSGSLTLPAYDLAAGRRVVVQESGVSSGDPPVVSPGLILFNSNISWGTQGGAVALLSPVGDALDFVGFGLSTVAPPAGTTWQPPVEALPCPGLTESFMSLARQPEGTDTDTAGDFCVTLATPGDANAGPCRVPHAPGTLLLTEVDVATPEQLELHNPGAAPVDLEGWRIKVAAATQATRALPPYALDPGAYVTVIDDAPDPAAPFADTAGLHIGALSLGSFTGFVQLVEPEAHAGVDFVRWGALATRPMPPSTWADDPARLPAVTNGLHLGRQTLVDTDTAADWCLQLPTLGAPNGACQ